MTKVSIFIVLLPYLLCTRTTAVVHGRDTPIDRSNTTANECGVTRYYPDETNRLIPNGERSLPGQWPWVVAIGYRFFIKDEVIYKFLCAGNLVSTRHVILAAHWLKMGYSLNARNDTRKTETLHVGLGGIRGLGWNMEGVVNRDVRSYKIHPDYAHTTSADSDLAILTLFRRVDYNAFIQPICLWSESAPIALEHVVNETGYVVGWGLDGTGNYNQHSQMMKVPIMSQETCLRSDWILAQITSERTLCADLRNQVGPCIMDSRGSGLVLYDASTGRYQLRGIASRSFLGKNRLCDPNMYVVYVDVAKYLPWIREQIADV